MRFPFRLRTAMLLIFSLALYLGERGGPGAGVLHALEPATPLTQVAHQFWSMENGLPQNTVAVLLQSSRGFVWAGTELGLVRFDGLNFKTFDHATTAGFPDAEIRCITESPDGTLWVGTSEGLVEWKDNHARLFRVSDGLPANGIRGVAITTGGSLWVWTESGLAQRTPGNTIRFAAAQPDTSKQGFPAGSVTSIAVDHRDGLWVATTSGAAVFRAGKWLPFAGGEYGSALVAGLTGGDLLVSVASGIWLDESGRSRMVVSKADVPIDGVSFLTRLADGSVVAASKSTVLTTQDGRPPVRFQVSRQAGAQQLPGTRIESIFADREGGLWVGSNHGLARIYGGRIEQFPATDPLSTRGVIAWMEDREGDLWVGTETAGLHLLRPARFVPVGAAEGLSSDAVSAIVEAGHDVSASGLWIGTRDTGVNRIESARTISKIRNISTRDGLPSDIILSLAAGTDGFSGDVWVGTPDGLGRIQGKRVTSLTSADGLPDDFIRSLLAVPDGSVWIGTRRGLTHFNPHVHGTAAMRTYTQGDGLGSDLVGALARSADGDLWIATLDGLTRLHEEQPRRIRNFTRADGLSSNVITALEVTPEGRLWIGTQSDGINLFDGSRFKALRDKAGQLPADIHALIADDRGFLWMAYGGGLARAGLAALETCAGGGSCEFAVERFTTSDGLRSRETSSNSHPTACRTGDGRLWFSTPRGVVVVDPHHFSPTAAAPPVAIERFAVDDADMGPDDGEGQQLHVAAGHLRFAFDYAGLSFAAPQKVRYQYTLEGFDHGWTDAGTRRTAYYTNIPPGHYRFRVRAGFSDAAAAGAPGESTSEAEFAFVLQPHLYQTAWFRVLVSLLLLAVALIIFRLVFRRRMMHVEREFKAVMGERYRIAREIHDTLAQGYVGISMQLEVLGELLRHGRTEAATKHLDLTRGYVREGLEDARKSIWALRSQDAGEQTLPVRLRRLVEKAQDRGLVTAFDVHGAYRPLDPGTEQELLRIAQEAIHNVKKHAGATLMTVRLEYDETAVAMTVEDSGRGFAFSAAASSSGRYGLTGMRERAALIGGRLEINSAPGQGTTVRVDVSVARLDSRAEDPAPSGLVDDNVVSTSSKQEQK